jgi:hypothetical protein
MIPNNHTRSNSRVSKDAAADKCPRPRGRREPPLRELFHLLVKCSNETQQRELYERLTKEGHDCRVLSL